jgi:hypothetical protein
MYTGENLPIALAEKLRQKRPIAEKKRWDKKVLCGFWSNI